MLGVKVGMRRQRLLVGLLLILISVASPASAEKRASTTSGKLQPGVGKAEHFKDCPTCPEMIVVRAGKFTMGSPKTEKGREEAEGPQHEVTIAKSFAVGRFAVTRGEFAGFVKDVGYTTDGSCLVSNGSDRKEEQSDKSWRSPGFAQNDQHPVVCVNWNDAQAFAAWLSKQTEKPYRLLSEAEREYVTRAGTTSRYNFGNDEKSLCRFGNVWDLTAKKGMKGAERRPITDFTDCDDGYAYTAPVGQFAANAFGIYDTHGNIWEWTDDCWNDNYQSAPTDGSSWKSGDCSRRVIRGGSWYNLAVRFRSAYRLSYAHLGRSDNLGFRVARTLNP
jgi:formylglycine-generating enzyme required for sulfatase activity